ncbi:hypothetical protein DFS33DRAFT_1274540 [Desarmillaria ectypa]|nr:hypothetical protein DFS33DRAFT_1274540 [Desarmillaria ectypa]
MLVGGTGRYRVIASSVICIESIHNALQVWDGKAIVAVKNVIPGKPQLRLLNPKCHRKKSPDVHLYAPFQPSPSVRATGDSVDFLEFYNDYIMTDNWCTKASKKRGFLQSHISRCYYLEGVTYGITLKHIVGALGLYLNTFVMPPRSFGGDACPGINSCGTFYSSDMQSVHARNNHTEILGRESRKKGMGKVPHKDHTVAKVEHVEDDENVL